jgi:hypothetical protein
VLSNLHARQHKLVSPQCLHACGPTCMSAWAC